MRVGTTEQRLLELESLPIVDAHIGSFDEARFNVDHPTAFLKSQQGSPRTSSSFSEQVGRLGRYAPWYHRHYDGIANPSPGDPRRDMKQKQYHKYLIGMHQTEIGKLRVLGRAKQATELEADLQELTALVDEFATCDDLLVELQELGAQRNNCIRISLFCFSILLGMVFLLFAGDFQKQVAASVHDIHLTLIQLNASNSFDSERLAADMKRAVVGTWSCHLGCYIARLLSAVFFLLSGLILFECFFRTVLNAIRRFVAIVFKCLCCGQCKDCQHLIDSNLDRQVHKKLVSLQHKLDQVLGPRAQSSRFGAKEWDRPRALRFCGVESEQEQPAHADNCRSCLSRHHASQQELTGGLCNGCLERRCKNVAAVLKLMPCQQSSLEEFDSVEVGDSMWKRLCTAAGRQKAALEDGHTPNLPAKINTNRLLLATYQEWCAEVIEGKYKALVAKLRSDEDVKQCKKSQQEKTEIPADLVARMIHYLSELKAEKKYFWQKVIMYIGSLVGALAPWIVSYFGGCDDDRSCGVNVTNPSAVIANESSGSRPSGNESISQHAVWTECKTVYAPSCLTSAGMPVFSNGAICQVESDLHARIGVYARHGWDQPHVCLADNTYGEEDWWHYWNGWHYLSAVAEFTLTVSIFSLWLRVLQNYHLRLLFMQYFSRCVPWPGFQNKQQERHCYGLLPHFDLNVPGNILAWNNIRLYLQTFEAKEFNQEKHIIVWILVLPLSLVAAKLVKLAQSFADDNLSSRIVFDTFALKICIMQVQASIVIINLLWTGVKTTRMQEHGLHHILLLKKAQLSSLNTSASKRVEMLVPNAFTLPQLHSTIETYLGISQAQQYVAVNGVCFHGGTTKIVDPDRQTFTKERDKLIQKKYRRKHLVAVSDHADNAELDLSEDDRLK
eukprot:COSAG02_NODE_2688_length_8234_cov_45.754230_4_plen_897_part_00